MISHPLNVSKMVIFNNKQPIIIFHFYKDLISYYSKDDYNTLTVELYLIHSSTVHVSHLLSTNFKCSTYFYV